MSNVKYQMSIRLNFCRSVPLDFLWSFFFRKQEHGKSRILKKIVSWLFEKETRMVLKDEKLIQSDILR